ncbi:DUF4236 domain-containing protein [Paenibacillus sp. FSL L8-0340]|uniref:DUF4236 domain-containing protein n=1 Tax=Paenibacillus sp. FSL L8-0340 TaxID=2954685 RepID=UPI003159612F
MAFGFRKSFSIVPGVRLNGGKKSAGLSFGTKGLRYSINSRTGGRMTASIPGTGLSYSTSTSRSRNYRSNAYQRKEELRRQKETRKLDILEQARYEVELYENKIELIKSVHKECDEVIDWMAIERLRPPFVKGTSGPKQIEAEFKLATYKPSFMEKVLKNDSKKQVLLSGIDNAKNEDKENYINWENLNQLARDINRGDVDAYFKVIDEMDPLEDLSEYGSGFNFFAYNSDFLEVEFQINSENVIPKETKTLTSTGKLSSKPMNKTTFYDLEQDYVCSCALRIARNMFSLLPIDNIYIHAMDSMLNPTTGHNEDCTILSVKIDKNTLNRLNFESIDCSDSMQNFKHNMKFLKTAGFKPVAKLQIS